MASAGKYIDSQAWEEDTSKLLDGGLLPVSASNTALQPAGSPSRRTVLVLGMVVGALLAAGATHMATQKQRVGEVRSEDFISLGAVLKKPPLKILFVGNSFTFGPPAHDTDQTSLNNVPNFFQLIAQSMQEDVIVAEDTLGGCTLYQAHMPSVNPESQHCNSTTACQLVSTGCPPSHPDCKPRVVPEDQCTVPAGMAINPTYHPCPQLLGRQPYGPWDVISLQEQSALPTVKRAREVYMYPAVKEYVQAAKKQAEWLKEKGEAGLKYGKTLIAAYDTWAYFNGSMYQCVGNSKPGCFPLGTLNELSGCAESDAWHQTTHTAACQEYAIARGYASMLEYGADLFIPAGLANLAARKEETIPSACKAAVDKEYPDPGLLGSLDLPLKVDPADASWSGKKAHELFRDLGKVQTNPDGTPKYCTDKCTHDHHASTIAMYLNALVFFATVFKKSPVGAEIPSGQTINGMVLPKLDEGDAKKMQRIAAQIVLPHLDVWWNKKNV